MRAAWIAAVAGVVLSGGCGGGSSGSGSTQPPPQQGSPQEPPPQQPPPPPGEMPPAQPPPQQPAPPGEGSPSPGVDSANGGKTQWTRRLGGSGEEAAIALATGGDGSTTLLTRIGSAGSAADFPDAYGLVRLDRSGAVAWSRQLSSADHALLRGASIAVSPAGKAVLASRLECRAGGDCSFDFGGGPIGEGGSVVAEFDEAGNLAWQTVSIRLASNVAVGADGSVVIVVLDDGGTAFLRKYGPDGVKLWDVIAPRIHDPPNPRWAVASAPGGDIVLGNRLGFSKHDPDGRMRWSADLSASGDAAGDVEAIGATSLGTVVAVMTHFGAVTWAGTNGIPASGGAGAFIAVAESDGTPRFGNEFASDVTIVGGAVDPAGRLAILTRRRGCDEEVWRWNLAGELLWSRSLAAASCGAGAAVLGTAIAVDATSHDVVVGGAMAGTAEFGSGPVTSNGGSDAFAVDIAP